MLWPAGPLYLSLEGLEERRVVKGSLGMILPVNPEVQRMRE
jgi:hypothetical protein